MHIALLFGSSWFLWSIGFTSDIRHNNPISNTSAYYTTGLLTYSNTQNANQKQNQVQTQLKYTNPAFWLLQAKVGGPSFGTNEPSSTHRLWWLNHYKLAIWHYCIMSRCIAQCLGIKYNVKVSCTMWPDYKTTNIQQDQQQNFVWRRS